MGNAEGNLNDGTLWERVNERVLQWVASLRASRWSWSTRYQLPVRSAESGALTLMRGNGV
jgi:hypothetical protein